MSGTDKTKRIPRSTAPVGQPLDAAFASTLEAEISASLARVLRQHKAEVVAADVDRKRSTVYRWAAHPADVPVAALPVLARYDPDPEMLARVAGHLLAEVSAAALRRQSIGRAITIIEEIAPGRVVVVRR